MKNWLFILLFFSLQSNAKVEVAFVEVHFADGSVQQLESGGRFSHLAISYRGQWLHAHPYRGVELITTEQFQKLYQHSLIETISLKNIQEISELELETYVGKPFDSNFLWADESAYYCSKLVAKILKLKPTPMTFDPTIWPKAFKSRRGLLGISPDEVYQQITSPAFLQRLITQSCEKLF